jgi:hypothetical protein
VGHEGFVGGRGVISFFAFVLEGSNSVGWTGFLSLRVRAWWCGCIWSQTKETCAAAIINRAVFPPWTHCAINLISKHTQIFQNGSSWY